jgi:hypothetical protein
VIERYLVTTNDMNECHVAPVEGLVAVEPVDGLITAPKTGSR